MELFYVVNVQPTSGHRNTVTDVVALGFGRVVRILPAALYCEVSKTNDVRSGNTDI